MKKWTNLAGLWVIVSTTWAPTAVPALMVIDRSMEPAAQVGLNNVFSKSTSDQEFKKETV